MKFKWVACFDDADAMRACALETLPALGYGAIVCSIGMSDTAAWIASVRTAASRASLPVWPLLGDAALRGLSNADRAAVLDVCIDVGANAPPAIFVVSSLPVTELQERLNEWRVSAGAEANLVRVIVARKAYQPLPVGSERLNWADLVAGGASANNSGLVKAGLRWVVEHLEMQRQDPGQCHCSIYLPSLLEATEQRSFAPRHLRPFDSTQTEGGEMYLAPEVVAYWIKEAAIISSNNPMQPERLMLVRGDPTALRGPAPLRSDATQTSSRANDVAPERKSSNNRIAVVLHLYYPQFWPEFALSLANITEPFDLYVTTPVGLADSVGAVIRARFATARVFDVANRGRDVLPFFLVHSRFDLARYSFICKLHSKQSLHVTKGDAMPIPVTDGNHWRQLFLQGLLGDAAHTTRLLDKFDDLTIGMMCPEALILSPTAAARGLVTILHKWLDRVKLTWPETATFAAGSMFWVRTDAIRPLLALSIDAAHIEGERGQVDFTLHHALERLFGMVVYANGYRLAATPRANEP